MAEFFHMGGYAAFVWSAYGISAAVLILSVVLPLVEKNKIQERIKRMLHEEQD
jgi:heme exporter protein D